MSKTCQEDRPLLNDTMSDEEILSEHFTTTFHRRTVFINTGERARNKIKGAANIISSWSATYIPTSITYWWFVIGMLCLMTLFLYNSVAALYLLPSNYLKGTTTHENIEINNMLLQKPISPDIFMHILVEGAEQFNLDIYLSYIDLIKYNFPRFNYTLYVIINDTYNTVTEFKSEEENNEEAFNTIMSENSINKQNINYTIYHKITIVYTTLSEYLDKSPLIKKWRQIPPQLIPFLVRSISIWDKGGIAFNPDILLPSYKSNQIYKEKLTHILTKYGEECDKKDINNFKDRHNNTAYEKLKRNKKLNNIRDIIEALEEPNSYNISQINLIGDETHNVDSVVSNYNKSNESKLYYNVIIVTNEAARNNTATYKNHPYIVESKNSNLYNNNISDRKSHNIDGQYYEPYNLKQFNNNTSQTHLMKIIKNFNNEIDVKPVIINNKSVTSSDELTTKTQTNAIPNILSVQVNTLEDLNKLSICENMNKLVIDLKGNIIATETACHAFIGTVISKTNHYSGKETITDYIIRELSIFCKGLLSICKGIEVILV